MSFLSLFNDSPVWLFFQLFPPSVSKLLSCLITKQVVQNLDYIRIEQHIVSSLFLSQTVHLTVFLSWSCRRASGSVTVTDLWFLSGFVCRSLQTNTLPLALWVRTQKRFLSFRCVHQYELCATLCLSFAAKAIIYIPNSLTAEVTKWIYSHFKIVYLSTTSISCSTCPYNSRKILYFTQLHVFDNNLLWRLRF